MADKLENKKDSQNYVELTESQIFEKIKKDLTPIQNNLAEKKITVDEAKSELKKINERLQGSKLENKDKKDLGDAFNRLERNIDKNNSETEFKEVVNLLERLTQKDLENLSREVQQNKQRRNPERTPEVQKGITAASKKIEDLPRNDKNKFANRALQKIHEFLG